MNPQQRQQHLITTTQRGVLSEVASLLLTDLDVNWSNLSGCTALHWASQMGHTEVVKLLLAHPHINVNVQCYFGQTPVAFACERGHLSAVKVLLSDPRVNMTVGDHEGATPLWKATYFGRLEVLKWLMASGRDLGDLGRKGRYFTHSYTALEMATMVKETEIVELLERFMADPVLTRCELCEELGGGGNGMTILVTPAAELFALMVFVCDDLLYIKTRESTFVTEEDGVVMKASSTQSPSSPSDPATSNSSTTSTTFRVPFTDVSRFFVMASQLPMEVQMILCHRVVGSMKQNIVHKDSELAFKHLARILLLLYPPQGL